MLHALVNYIADVDEGLEPYPTVDEWTRALAASPIDHPRTTTMSDAKTLKRGDACPNCGNTFHDAPVPTEAQRAAAANRDDPVALPPYYDTASVEFRAEHGALARCLVCGYVTRFSLRAGPAAVQTLAAPAGPAPTGETA